APDRRQGTRLRRLRRRAGPRRLGGVDAGTRLDRAGGGVGDAGRTRVPGGGGVGQEPDAWADRDRGGRHVGRPGLGRRRAGARRCRGGGEPMSRSLLESLSVGAANALQTPAERRDELARDVVAAAYLRGAFVLSSGQPSSYYIDKYLFATKPTVLRRLASLLAERVPDVDRLAGPELGSVPITAALSLETGVPFVIVRKERKAYGTSAGIEGELHQGERVLLVEDVV